MPTPSRRWRHRPEGSTWGDFGEDDQLGRLNLLTPEKVRQGVNYLVDGNACGVHQSPCNTMAALVQVGQPSSTLTTSQFCPSICTKSPPVPSGFV